MVRPMLRPVRAAALIAVLALVQACGRKPDAEAAEAVRGTLAAVVAGDVAGFEAHLDRTALRADLRRQLEAVARERGLEVDGGPADAALDRMIGPAGLHLVAAGTGAPLAAPPSATQVGLMIRKADGGRVCLHELSPAAACVLTFARETAGWRLVAMPATDRRIEVPPEPAKKG